MHCDGGFWNVIDAMGATSRGPVLIWQRRLAPIDGASLIMGLANLHLLTERQLLIVE